MCSFLISKLVLIYNRLQIIFKSCIGGNYMLIHFKSLSITLQTLQIEIELITTTKQI